MKTGRNILIGAILALSAGAPAVAAAASTVPAIGVVAAGTGASSNSFYHT
jgi:hypothetical protein